MIYKQRSFTQTEKELWEKSIFYLRFIYIKKNHKTKSQRAQKTHEYALVVEFDVHENYMDKYR